jgi:hypothetical protein
MMHRFWFLCRSRAADLRVYGDSPEGRGPPDLPKASQSNAAHAPPTCCECRLQCGRVGVVNDCGHVLGRTSEWVVCVSRLHSVVIVCVSCACVHVSASVDVIVPVDLNLPVYACGGADIFASSGNRVCVCVSTAVTE